MIECPSCATLKADDTEIRRGFLRSFQPIKCVDLQAELLYGKERVKTSYHLTKGVKLIAGK